MTVPAADITPDFQRGWDAALAAVRDWHESQAKKTLIQARRDRFPKNLEREAEVHRRSAEIIVTLTPDDV
jgi:hypothetical protein